MIETAEYLLLLPWEEVAYLHTEAGGNSEQCDELKIELPSLDFLQMFQKKKRKKNVKIIISAKLCKR